MSKAIDLATYAGNTNAAREALERADDIIGRLYVSNPNSHGLRAFSGYPEIIRAMAEELGRQSDNSLTRLEKMFEDQGDD